MSINDTFTSTGAKFFAHQEAMAKLRNGQGQPIVTHLMLTDVCNHSCAFCSVQARAGDSLPMGAIVNYLGILQSYGLKAVILSGGGNPILYKCKQTGANFNDVVDHIHSIGLEIGLITNGMPMKLYLYDRETKPVMRHSWNTVHPKTLDKLTWIRISMAGFDHDENMVYVPNIDPAKTTLGFSYVAHDIYREPADPHHGKVSAQADLLSGDRARRPDQPFESRMGDLTEQIGEYVKRHRPRYVRLLPNCLEPSLIPLRCEQLSKMAQVINCEVGEPIAFVQNKPPSSPKACYLGYIHPVLNSDGYVYPCDSCVLNETAGHQFANPWRICHWSEIHSIYENPVRSLIADPSRTCPGCVFSKSNAILNDVVNGTIPLTPPTETPEHVNFV